MVSCTFYITSSNAMRHTTHSERTRCLYQQRIRHVSAGQPHICSVTSHEVILWFENEVVSKKLCQSEIKDKKRGIQWLKTTSNKAGRMWRYLVTGTAEVKLYTRQHFDRWERISAQTLGRWEGRQQRNRTSAHRASLGLSKKHSTPVWTNSTKIKEATR